MSSTQRYVLLAVAVVLATTLAGCGGLGGSDAPSDPATVTGLSVNCESVQNVPQPPSLQRLQVASDDGRVLFGLDRPMPEGHALYVKDDGEPVDGYAPRKAGAGPMVAVDPGSTLVIVEKNADGSCDRWEGTPQQLTP